MKPGALVEPLSVVLSPRMALYFERRFELHELRKRVRGRDAEVDDALQAIRIAAMSHVSTEVDGIASAVAGSAVVSAPEVRPRLTVMRATDVADLEDCTTRAVRMAADAGRLVGTKDDAGRWTFTPEAVATWRAVRSRKAS